MHGFQLWLRARKSRPDVIYVDRSNILIAAILARWSKAPVVLRLLGVPPDLQTIFSGHHPAKYLWRWAYRSPFAFVIGTRDGSGSPAWLERALDPSVPREVLLNGADVSDGESHRPAILEAIPPDRMVVTFLGRIEAIKGAEFFIDSLLELLEEDRERIHALVIGDGSRLAALEEKVAGSDASQIITFTGSLAPADVMAVLLNTDVYVSLNRQGHLSNSTLEALAAGVCLVLQRLGPISEPDVELEALIPAETVTQIENDAEPKVLAETLSQLASDPDARRRQAAQLQKAIAGRLNSWDVRIAYEIERLEAIALKRQAGE